MLLIVGLGNPGAKYETTRHNIGFLAIDRIARAHGFSPERSKFQAQISEGKLGTQKVFLLKPQTFMNLSGQSVGEAMRFYKLAPEDVIVLHDELDLAPGKLRVKSGGGHAGHNGLRSLHEHIGAAFTRVRLGIGHPGDKRAVSAYVLHDFAKADWDWIDPLLDAVAEGAPMLAADDAAGFQNLVARRTRPEAPPKPKPGPTAEAQPNGRDRAGSKTGAAVAGSDAPSDAKPSAGQSDETADASSPFAALQRLAARFSRK